MIDSLIRNIIIITKFTDTIKINLTSLAALNINQNLVIGRIEILIGDDNTNCFRGTWNADYTVKTVTKMTASLTDYCDIVFKVATANNDSRTGVYYSNGKIGIISAKENNFKPSIDKSIPLFTFYGYRAYDSSYYWWLTSNLRSSDQLSKLNGVYNFTFDFDYLGKHYSIKKKLIYSY